MKESTVRKIQSKLDRLVEEATLALRELEKVSPESYDKFARLSALEFDEAKASIDRAIDRAARAEDGDPLGDRLAAAHHAEQALLSLILSSLALEETVSRSLGTE